MRITEPGYVEDQILFLGTPRIASFLVTGEVHALIGGNVAWGVERLEGQLDDFGIERDRIRYLVITHSHHDHCGAVPYLYRRYPHLEVVASPYGAHILKKPEAVDLMRNLNRQTLDHLGRSHEHEGISLDFDEVPVRHQVDDGDVLPLGENLTLQFWRTPGHSRCSLSAYLPERRMLFPGDAVPYPEPGREELMVTANHDFDDYLESLEKLARLPVDAVAYEHGGVLTGSDAAQILETALHATRRQRERLRKRYRELKDLDLLVDEIAEKYLELELFRLLSPDAMRAIVRRMVRSALGMIEREKDGS